MYTITKGPSKIVAKTRRGVTQNLDHLSRKSSNETNEDVSNVPRPVFHNNASNKRNYHNQPNRYHQEVRISPQHEAIIRFISDSWSNISTEYEQISPSSPGSNNSSCEYKIVNASSLRHDNHSSPSANNNYNEPNVNLKINKNNKMQGANVKNSVPSKNVTVQLEIVPNETLSSSDDSISKDGSVPAKKCNIMYLDEAERYLDSVAKETKNFKPIESNKISPEVTDDVQRVANELEGVCLSDLPKKKFNLKPENRDKCTNELLAVKKMIIVYSDTKNVDPKSVEFNNNQRPEEDKPVKISKKSDIDLVSDEESVSIPVFERDQNEIKDDSLSDVATMTKYYAKSSDSQSSSPNYHESELQQNNNIQKNKPSFDNSKSTNNTQYDKNDNKKQLLVKKNAPHYRQFVRRTNNLDQNNIKSSPRKTTQGPRFFTPSKKISSPPNESDLKPQNELAPVQYPEQNIPLQNAQYGSPYMPQNVVFQHTPQQNGMHCMPLQHCLMQSAQNGSYVLVQVDSPNHHYTSGQVPSQTHYGMPSGPQHAQLSGQQTAPITPQQFFSMMAPTVSHHVSAQTPPQQYNCVQVPSMQVPPPNMNSSAPLKAAVGPPPRTLYNMPPPQPHYNLHRPPTPRSIADAYGHQMQSNFKRLPPKGRFSVPYYSPQNNNNVNQKNSPQQFSQRHNSDSNEITVEDIKVDLSVPPPKWNQ